MRNEPNNTHSFQYKMAHTSNAIKLSAQGILLILTTLVFGATLANDIFADLATAAMIVGTIIVLYGLFKAIITLPITLFRIFHRPFDPQATVKIIHPAESLSPEKRKIMFKTWERNWIESEANRLKNMN